MPKAKAAALRALELDGNLAEAYSPLGVVGMLYDRNWTDAERQFRRALDIKPGYGHAHIWYSYLLSILGRHTESLELVRRAADLDPLSLLVHQTMARSLHYARRYEESIEQCRRLLDMDPGYITGYETIVRPLSELGRYEEAEGFALEGVARSGRWSLLLGMLGRVYAISGKRAEARAIVAELEEQSRRRYVPRFHIALVYYGLRDEASALREIERSIAERSGVVSWLMIDPHIEWLKGNPRFDMLTRELGLPEHG